MILFTLPPHAAPPLLHRRAGYHGCRSRILVLRLLRSPYPIRTPFWFYTVVPFGSAVPGFYRFVARSGLQFYRTYGSVTVQRHGLPRDTVLYATILVAIPVAWFTVPRFTRTPLPLRFCLLPHYLRLPATAFYGYRGAHAAHGLRFVCRGYVAVYAFAPFTTALRAAGCGLVHCIHLYRCGSPLRTPHTYALQDTQRCTRTHTLPPRSTTPPLPFRCRLLYLPACYVLYRSLPPHLYGCLHCCGCCTTTTSAARNVHRTHGLLHVHRYRTRLPYIYVHCVCCVTRIYHAVAGYVHAVVIAVLYYPQFLHATAFTV